MSKIIIKRPNSWANQSISNNIFIDGESVGFISTGMTVQYDIAPGRHTIVAKSKWGGNSKVIEVDVGTDECKTINLTAVKYITWLPFLIPFIIATIIFLISIIFGVDLKFAHLMLGFLGIYLVYYFTFGKDRYWKLREG